MTEVERLLRERGIEKQWLAAKIGISCARAALLSSTPSMALRSRATKFRSGSFIAKNERL